METNQRHVWVRLNAATLLVGNDPSRIQVLQQVAIRMNLIEELLVAARNIWVIGIYIRLPDVCAEPAGPKHDPRLWTGEIRMDIAIERRQPRMPAFVCGHLIERTCDDRIKVEIKDAGTFRNHAWGKQGNLIPPPSQSRPR